MAVFGIPVLHEDDALRAARAGADMREALAALNKELERDRGVATRFASVSTRVKWSWAIPVAGTRS
jgi:class 3 adenylate cyclase